MMSECVVYAFLSSDEILDGVNDLKVRSGCAINRIASVEYIDKNVSKLW